MQAANTPHATTATDAIATEAFYQWLQAGKPAGRDQEFWLKAEARLRNGGSTAKATGKKNAATPGSATRKIAGKR